LKWPLYQEKLTSNAQSDQDSAQATSDLRLAKNYYNIKWTINHEKVTSNVQSYQYQFKTDIYISF